MNASLQPQRGPGLGALVDRVRLAVRTWRGDPPKQQAEQVAAWEDEGGATAPTRVDTEKS